MRTRVLLASAGVLLGLFGVFRLLTQVPVGDVAILALWLIGAIVIHDGILSPIVLAVGWTIARFVPPRARRYLQGALIVAALITVVAVPMVYREGSQPAAKAILQQNFGGNLTLLLAIIGALTLAAYAVRVATDHSPRRPNAGRSRPHSDVGPPVTDTTTHD